MDNVNMTKLDGYSYVVLPGVISIKIDGLSDPIMVDILSEIHNSHGLFFLEGHFYDYLGDYLVLREDDQMYMELPVVEVAPESVSKILQNRRNA